MPQKEISFDLSAYPKFNGEALVALITDEEVASVSADHFRETGENLNEWAVSSPVDAYLAVRAAILSRNGNDDSEVLEQYPDPDKIDVPTQVFVFNSGLKPTLDSMMPIFRRKRVLRPLARIVLNDQTDPPDEV